MAGAQPAAGDGQPQGPQGTAREAPPGTALAIACRATFPAAPGATRPAQSPAPPHAQRRAPRLAAARTPAQTPDEALPGTPCHIPRQAPLKAPWTTPLRTMYETTPRTASSTTLGVIPGVGVSLASPTPKALSHKQIDSKTHSCAILQLRRIASRQAFRNGVPSGTARRPEGRPCTICRLFAYCLPVTHLVTTTLLTLDASRFRPVAGGTK